MRIRGRARWRGASHQSRVYGSARSLICRRSRSRAKDLDARSDLFSFGAVLYEMATGALPFRGDSSAMIFEAILNRAPVAAVRLESRLPPNWKTSSTKPGERPRLRYQHAADMRTDLKRVKRETDSEHFIDQLRPRR